MEARPTRQTTAPLIGALTRIRREAEALSRGAQRAIEQHAFDPYHQFRGKIDEHEALVSVLRARLDEKDVEAVQAVSTEERLRYELLIRSSLHFFYALSARPILPIGARETFIDELAALAAAKERLEDPEHASLVSGGVIDDLETARLILEEIAEKAPRLIDFSAHRRAAAAASS